MADQKISALPAGVPASSDLVPFALLAGPTTEAVQVSSLSGMALLAEQTASGSTSLDFTSRNAGSFSGALIQSDFDTYVFEFLDLTPASNTNIRMLMSTNGGSTWDTGTNYWTAYFRWSRTGSNTAGSATDTNVDLTAGETASSDATHGGLSGQVTLYNPGSAVWKKFVGQTTYWFPTTPEILGSSIAAAYQVTTAVNAVRFIAASGNLTSGTIRVYGLRK